MSQPSSSGGRNTGRWRRWRRRPWRCSALLRSCSRSTRSAPTTAHASARQAFLGYTDLAFKNPKFSHPDYDAIKAGSRDERMQYESFVSYFLYACEETIAAFADKREWQASCDYDLKPHLPFLCEKNAAQPAYLATYGTETQQWVKASLKTASVTPPDCKLGKT